MRRLLLLLAYVMISCILSFRLGSSKTPQRTGEMGMVFSLGPAVESVEQACGLFAAVRAALPDGFPVVVLTHRANWSDWLGPTEAERLSACAGDSAEERWTVVVNHPRVKYRPPVRGRRGATEIENALTMIDCLKAAPLEWQLVLWWVHHHHHQPSLTTPPHHHPPTHPPHHHPPTHPPPTTTTG